MNLAFKIINKGSLELFFVWVLIFFYWCFWLVHWTTFGKLHCKKIIMELQFWSVITKSLIQWRFLFVQYYIFLPYMLKIYSLEFLRYIVIIADSDFHHCMVWPIRRIAAKAFPVVVDILSNPLASTEFSCYIMGTTFVPFSIASYMAKDS